MLPQLEALQDCLWQLCMPSCHLAADLDAQDMLTGPAIMRSAFGVHKRCTGCFCRKRVAHAVLHVQLLMFDTASLLQWMFADDTAVEDDQAVQQLLQRAACCLTVGHSC